MNSDVKPLAYITVTKYAQVTENMLMFYEIHVAKCEKHGNATNSLWFGKSHWLDLLLMFKPLAQIHLSQKKAQSFKTSSNMSTESVKIMKESSNLMHTCYYFKDENYPEGDCFVLPWNQMEKNRRLQFQENKISNTCLKVVVFPVCCPLTLGMIEVKKILGIPTDKSLDITSYFFQPISQNSPMIESLPDQNVKITKTCNTKLEKVQRSDAPKVNCLDEDDVECELNAKENMNLDIPVSTNMKTSKEVDFKMATENKVKSQTSEPGIIKELLNEHLLHLLQTNENYLKDIFRGKISCQRHEDYKKGGKQRQNLNYQIYMTLYTDDQVDIIMDHLVGIFCRKHNKFIDYVLRVLLPETLIKIAMDVFNILHEEAEQMLFEDVFKN